MVSRFKPKLCGRHWWRFRIAKKKKKKKNPPPPKKKRHFVTISKMATTTILKVFNCYLLPNGKSDWAETWWKALGQRGNLEMLKSFRSDIKDSHHSGHLEIFKPHLPQKLDWAESWWEALERYGHSELLKSYSSNNQNECPVSHFEILQTTSAKSYTGLSWKLMVGIGVLWWFRIVKIVHTSDGRWRPSWNSSNHISSQIVSRIVPKLDRRHWSDMKIQNCQYPR